MWRAAVLTHPVFLVSVQQLEVDRDSLPLRVLSGVPEQEKKTVASLLSGEPHLWARYGAWLSANEPTIWEELLRMAVQQDPHLALNLHNLTECVRRGGRVDELEPFLKAIGVKQAVEAVGVKQVVEAVGVQQVWENLSPQQREELLRLAQQEASGPPGQKG